MKKCSECGHEWPGYSTYGDPCPRCQGFGIPDKQCTCKKMMQAFTGVELNIITAKDEHCPVHRK